MKKVKTTLFSRLFIYFFILISIPIISFSIVSTTIAKNKVIDELLFNVENLTNNQTNEIEILLEEYRHKAYILSKDETIISYLKSDQSTTDEIITNKIYTNLFQVMKGDTYNAAAYITSINGDIRLSTHPFKEDYDLRTHNDILELANPLMNSQPYTYTKLFSNAVASNDDNVIFTMLRYIFDDNNNAIGFVVIDIFKQNIRSKNTSTSLSTSLIVDKLNYKAAELNNPSDFYSFNNFPALNQRGEKDLTDKNFYSNNYIYSVKQISTTDFYIINYLDYRTYYNTYQQTIIVDILAIFIGLILSLIVAYFLTNQITKPIKELIKNMRQVEQGNLTISIEENPILEIQELNDSFNNMVIQIINLLQTTKESQKRIYEAEKESLQSQINPHFLFNTLNTIKSIAKLNNQQEIYTISIKLGQLLRSSIYTSETNVELEKSLELVKSYLTIQKLRFANKLDIEYEIDESILQIKTPKLIIQPLVENAIIHGLSPKMGKWFLKLEIKCKNNFIEINCIDNGIGFLDEQQMSDIELFANTKHVGVYNVYKRLKLEYNGKASLTFNRRKPEGTKATIKIPLNNALIGDSNEL